MPFIREITYDMYVANGTRVGIHTEANPAVTREVWDATYPNQIWIPATETTPGAVEQTAIVCEQLCEATETMMVKLAAEAKDAPTPVPVQPKIEFTPNVKLVVHTSSNGPFRKGETIPFHVDATNVGGGPLTGVFINAPNVAPSSKAISALAVSDTLRLSGVHVVTSDEVAVGTLVVSASVATDQMNTITAHATVTLSADSV